jgi:hypothetical protein
MPSKQKYDLVNKKIDSKTIKKEKKSIPRAQTTCHVVWAHPCHHTAFHWPAPAFLSPRWSSLVLVGRRWPSLACVGRHGPSWACVGLRWSSLAFVGRRWLSLTFVGLRWPDERY